ncbi:MAG TPA: restriction endonuclease subunit S [Desulfuromonadales bacterium]|nr:restriction endonuclease subunit S [Desulfuromonadales bacterium]
MQAITDNLDLWTSALLTRSTAGRGSGGRVEAYGIKKLRELILELAVRGKLVDQNTNEDSALTVLRLAKRAVRPIVTIAEQNVPVGWVSIPLACVIASNIGGGTPSKQNPSYWNGGIAWASVKDIQADKYLNATIDSITEEGLKDSSSNLIPPGRILVVTRMGLGKLAINKISVAINQDLRAIEPNEALNLDFAYLLFKALKLVGKGVTVKGITVEELHSITIALPPLAEQHRIVAKVDELMALCDQLEQQQTTASEAHQTLVETLLGTLTKTPVRPEPVEGHAMRSTLRPFDKLTAQGERSEDVGSGRTDFTEAWTRIANHFDTLFTTELSIEKLKQTILQLAVMGKLVPQDPNDEPASELLKKITAERAQLVKEGKARQKDDLPNISEDEAPYMLPNGWQWARLGQIFDISSGDGLTSANMNSSGDIPVYGGNGVTGYHDKANISKRTLVIGRVGYYCGSIHITPESAWVTDNAFVTTFSEQNIFIDYLYWLLKGTNLKENENATAQPVISARKLYPIVIGLPPNGEQHRIVTKVNELMTLCDTLKTRLADAQTTQLHLADTIVEQAVA